MRENLGLYSAWSLFQLIASSKFELATRGPAFNFGTRLLNLLLFVALGSFAWYWTTLRR